MTDRPHTRMLTDLANAAEALATLAETNWYPSDWVIDASACIDDADDVMSTLVDAYSTHCARHAAAIATATALVTHAEREYERCKTAVERVWRAADGCIQRSPEERSLMARTHRQEP